MTPRVNSAASDELTTESEILRALLGRIVAVKMRGPNGDFELTYDDGHVVVIDCGYVGATLFERRPR